MFSTADTIVAVATPPGRGGIGVVRLSGPAAHRIACILSSRRRLRPRYATFATIRSIEPRGLATDPSSGPAGSGVASPDGASRGRRKMSAPGAEGRSGRARGERGRPIDHAVLTYFPAPRSYTGEDVVEISAHGSDVALRAIVGAAMAWGARLARPGEFTLRAFLNGRLDLPQAEAIADLIEAVTPLQAQAAFDQLQGTLTERIGAIDAGLFDLIARLEASIDFPEEGYHFIEQGEAAARIDRLIEAADRLLADAGRGRIVREGLQIVLAGKGNVGKSSLFNALAGASRAIVAEAAGTTRDLVTETIELEGLRATLVDTAGIRSTEDTVENEGVRRAVQARSIADLVLVVLDGSTPIEPADEDLVRETAGRRRVLVRNKSDLPCVWDRRSLVECCRPGEEVSPERWAKGAGAESCAEASAEEIIAVSAVSGAGLSELRRAIRGALDVDALVDPPAITNARHITLVERAREALVRARQAAAARTPEEFLLADLQLARQALEEVSGKRAPEAVLEHVFARFCVGK